MDEALHEEIRNFKEWCERNGVTPSLESIAIHFADWQKEQDGAITDSVKFEEGFKTGREVGAREQMEQMDKEVQKAIKSNFGPFEMPEGMSEADRESYLDNDDLDTAVTNFYAAGGAYSPLDSTGLAPIRKIAHFTVDWLKRQLEKKKVNGEILMSKWNGKPVVRAELSLAEWDNYAFGDNVEIAILKKIEPVVIGEE